MPKNSANQNSQNSLKPICRPPKQPRSASRNTKVRQRGRKHEDGTDRLKPANRRFKSRACEGDGGAMFSSHAQAAILLWISFAAAEAEPFWLPPTSSTSSAPF